MPADLLPNDGTVHFFEQCNWLEASAMVSPHGAKFGHPWSLYQASVLEPEFQYVSRTWTTGDPTPDFPDIDSMITRANWIYPGPILARNRCLFTDFFEMTQTRWRIAWLPALADDGVKPAADAWNFIHFRWRIVTYDGGLGADPEDYSSSTGIDEKSWQLGIDPLPVGFNSALPETWPGTEWIDADVPAVDNTGGAIADTYWHPLWPQLWCWRGRPPVPQTVSQLYQGRVPGASQYQIRPYGRPIFNGKMVIDL